MSTPHSEQATTKNSRTLTVTLLSFCIAVAVFLLLLGWKQWRQGGAAAQPYPPTAVAAMRVTPTDIPNSLHAVGSLRAVREVVLAPEVAGRVVSIGFDAGETVAAEQQLLQLYDAPEQADRAAARDANSFAPFHRRFPFRFIIVAECIHRVVPLG